MPSLIDFLQEGRRIGQSGPWPRVVLDAKQWEFAAGELARGSWSLLGLWGEPSTVHMAILDEAAADIAIVSLDCPDRHFPSVGALHPPALRLERTAHDLFGLVAQGLPDTRPWLDHSDWGVRFPLGDRIDALRKSSPYRFLPVEGGGMHQIAVGPVHAGIIEPGHFRFTASGETVVRLEQRLGYVHKGIEGLMTGADLERAVQLAGRVSGDSTVAYAYAFSRAAEAALGLVAPDRAAWLRALAAELERLGQPSRRHRRHLQRRFVRADPRPYQRAARNRAARGQYRLRPSPDAGRHRARRRDPRPRRWRAGSHLRGAGHYPPAISGPDRTLRQHRFAAGSHRRYRPAQARAGKTICRRRLCRPRLGPILRRAPDARLSAL